MLAVTSTVPHCLGKTHRTTAIRQQTRGWKGRNKTQSLANGGVCRKSKGIHKVRVQQGCWTRSQCETIAFLYHIYKHRENYKSDTI